MVGYTYNHTRDTYKLYNPETNRVIMNRDIKWVKFKMTDPAETMKMFRNFNEDGLVPGIEEYKTPAPDPEYNIPVQVIPDEV